jgi:hypothetical protein
VSELHDHWDEAYEEGREAGRREAWSGEYDYRALMKQVRANTINECISVVYSVPCETTIHGDSWESLPGPLVKLEAVLALRALQEKP